MGAYIREGGGGGLISGCILLFPGRWAYNRGSLQAGGWGGLITGILRYIILSEGLRAPKRIIRLAYGVTLIKRILYFFNIKMTNTKQIEGHYHQFLR